MCSTIQTVSLGMGCFWSPEALFGHLPGVIRTRVGYAGGTAKDPTYRRMGDHSETVEIDFSPDIIRIEELLEVFWEHHNPVNINDYKGRQYRSLVLYRDEKQWDAIQRVIRQRKEQGKGEPQTEAAPYSGFYLAEDRHQKYYLKRYPDAMEKLSALYRDEKELVNSTLAARLNGLAKGYTNLERIRNEIARWPASLEERTRMIDLIQQIRW
ncbi:peptide-methionine (S)-S-oxide reductase MsrA [Paenibacillus filicis]|uniref:Peptide methionine sulfoxide reductase MsrA n=1 Tax=Paenibacillus gyeongsangnamensis TaxID=3388067 RepID=A0ABT4QAW2_9BACL|nr:peptide-methionine (S)-S-oxide reductase MsrA [Paenibacillus filicis]MCZ8513959.1 peptide-methionine (S)-S-oxide reductase MsrA [Paenibacillus filicis]